VPEFRIVVRNEFWLMLDTIRRRDPQAELRRTAPRRAQLREILYSLRDDIYNPLNLLHL